MSSKNVTLAAVVASVRNITMSMESERSPEVSWVHGVLM